MLGDTLLGEFVEASGDFARGAADGQLVGDGGSAGVPGGVVGVVHRDQVAVVDAEVAFVVGLRLMTASHSRPPGSVSITALPANS